MKTLLFLWSCCVIFPSVVRAELTLPQFFSDHMVLQRQTDANVWGNASPDAEVTLAFKGVTTTCTADRDGRWQAIVRTGDADSIGSSLVVKSGTDRVTIADVLVGEVWFASGQSNMAFTMNRSPQYESVTAQADFPAIRFFNAASATATTPQSDIAGQWTMCSPETAPGYSAVAFFFACKLHQELGVPIGVIKSAWGGQPVETFTSREALSTLPATQAMVDQLMKAESTFDEAKANASYKVRLDQWNAALAQWRAKPVDQRKKMAKKPAAPKRPLATEGKPGVLFDAMIHPFVGYSMQGAIWYQGEANSRPGAVPYDQTLPLMIGDWRKRWKDDFSFYYVQLASYRQPSTEPGTPDSWAMTQERMRLILSTTPKTGMAVTNDVGNANDIHPKNKQAPGERLARWALAKDYGRDMVYSGPLFRSAVVKDDSIQVTFDHVGKGLASRDGGPLERFEIADANQKWVWADATIISADTVSISNADLSNPVAVRYAWASNPEGANLVNSEGLPTSIFRTDDWADAEPAIDQTTSAINIRRRELATQIRENNVQRQTLDRKSDEYRQLTQQRQALLQEFQSTAPATAKTP